MAKSLRWRLQIWHAAILTAVVIGFGAVLYFQMRRTTLADIDSELLSGARVIEAGLRAMPPGFPSGFPPGRPPRGRRDGNRDFQRDDNFDAERPPPEFNRPPFPDGPRPGLGRPDDFYASLSLPRSMMFRRGPGDPPPYFVVFGLRGEPLAGRYDEALSAPSAPRQEFEFRNRSRFREVILRGPGGQLVLVGRDINPLLSGLNQLLWPIAISGLAVLGIGLLGGWWLSGRAIEPLQKISQTAAAITAHSLASRIDVAKMDTELAQLGTILNSMLQRLEYSFEQQMQFIADASHELRTPISVLSMHCELALSRQRNPAEYQTTLTTCARAAGRMQSLVEDLLTLARADAGQLMMRQEPLDLSLMVDESVQLLAPLATNHQVEIVSKTAPANCQGDSNQLLRLISNLISNAILYNRSCGTVTIETLQQQSDAVLRVTDTGCGMTVQELSRVFERFYRVDEARSREIGGSGLGLSICQSIATAHGGELRIDSTPGSGSTVELRLPAC